jgi:hypothetical protein
MIFLKSQDCVFQVEILRHVSARWEFGEVGQVTPLPPPPPNPKPRLPGRNSGQKAQKGPQKKISGRILADFTKNRQKRGRRKFVYCILKIKFITVITAKNKELLLNIFCGPFSACFW